MSDRFVVGDLIRSGSIRVEDGNHGNDRPRPNEFESTGVSFVRAADMSSGTVDFEGAGRINRNAVARIRKGIGRPGDILLSHKGTVGRVAVAPLDAPAFVCSPQTTFWRSLDENVIHQRYLRFVLLSPEFHSQLEVLKSQTDMAPYVSLSDQRRMTISLPPVVQQRAIAEVLGALDDKIAANDGVVTGAIELARALVRRQLEDSVVLGSIAEVTMGSSPPGTSYNDASDGLPFYQGVRDFGVRSPVRRVYTTSPVRVAHAGDVLLSVRAPVGRVNMAAESLCLGRGIAGLRSRCGTPWTLMHQVEAAGSAWEPYNSEGTVFGAISKDRLLAARVPAVRQDRAAALEAELNAIETHIGHRIAESASLAAARDELLPLLMSGKLRVRDALDHVDEVTR